MTQNKKPKQTLESAQYGLEINFNSLPWFTIILSVLSNIYPPYIHSNSYPPKINFQLLTSDNIFKL